MLSACAAHHAGLQIRAILSQFHGHGGKEKHKPLYRAKLPKNSKEIARIVSLLITDQCRMQRKIERFLAPAQSSTKNKKIYT